MIVRSKVGSLDSFTESCSLIGHQRLLPSSDTSSSFGSNPSDASSYSTDVVRAKPLQGASALKTAEPYDEETGGSNMTVKGAPTLINPPPCQPDVSEDKIRVREDGKLPTRHEIEKERARKEMEGKEKEDKESIPPHSQIGTIPSLASSELISKDRGVKGGKEGGGTHRFTLVDKDAVPLINGKKVSACESAYRSL